MTTGMRSWSKTAGSNNSADSNVNWAEGMAPSAVNNSARAEMASAAMWRDDNSGTLATSGTTAAFTVTSNQTFGSLADGDTIAVKFHAANNASATLNVDGTGAKAIQIYANQALNGGEFSAGNVAKFTYTASSTAWMLDGYNKLTGTISSPVGFQITSTSTSAPGYSFSGDTNTGMYWIGADNVGILANGTKAVDISTGTVVLSGSLNATLVTTGTVSATAATSSDQGTGASPGATTGLIVTPGKQQYHPSAAKFWIKCDAAGATNLSYNVASITDAGVGSLTVTIATDFSTASYCCLVGLQTDGAMYGRVYNTTPPAAGSVTCFSANFSGTPLDPDKWHVSGFGDQ